MASATEDLAEATGKVIGTQTKALATVLAATFAVLVKRGALTEEAIREEILKGLRKVASDLSPIEPDTAELITNIANLIERSLFDQP